jgi:ubiquinone/menaquinone biosynthesis C-methylase UbiE
MSTVVLDQPPSTAADVNYWPDSRCAKAFWSQRDAPPYHQLLGDTAAWLDPAVDESWLDLGCGGGQLARVLWEKSAGRLREVVALDCAAANADAIAKLRPTLQPPAPATRFRFQHADFSHGLTACADGAFDGVASGLAIQYAESFSVERRAWTTDAYDRLLAEVYRVLSDRGRFVFSVNVPEPNWLAVAVHGLSGVFLTPKPLRFLKNSLRMLRYGAWLKREARKGRFHYLPASIISEKLRTAGFHHVEHRVSFAGQAFVFRCRK